MPPGRKPSRYRRDAHLEKNASRPTSPIKECDDIVSRLRRDAQGERNASRPSSPAKECEDIPPMHSIGLLDLPTELQEAIFKFLPFDTIGKIRLVCRRFNDVGSTMLNSEFQRLRSLMQNRFQAIKAQMPRRESARRKHPLARESDIIETLHMRLTLLQMTFGKHIERKHCCFFPGEILDEVYRLLMYIKATPNLNRAYKVTDELFDLSTMAMEYFKEHVEPTLPEITYFATDFLDYTPSFSASPKTQLSLLEDHPGSSSSNCSLKSASSASQGQLKDMPLSPLNPTVKKRLRRLRESVNKNNGQVMTLKRELKLTQRRMTNQQKQIHELKARFEDYDKKFQNTSRKLSAVLQELSRCKTELQYWRSKSPACACGKATPVIELNLSDKWEEPVDEQNHSFPNDFNSEEFKPISADPDVAGCSFLNPVIVIPHAVTASQSTSSPDVLSPLCQEENTQPKTVVESASTSTLEPPNKPVTRSCKRKRDLDCDNVPSKIRLSSDPNNK